MEVDYEMMNIQEEEEDIYSDPVENYCRLHRTVTFLENDGRVTEDWIEEHKKHILKMREVFDDLPNINPEIGDPEFRRLAYECEILLRNLVQSIRLNRIFDVNFYRTLCQNMITMCEYFFSDDELESCMSKLSIKN